MQKPVMVCKECFPKRYGEVSEIFFEMFYTLTVEEGICDMCGKEKHLVLYKEREKGTVLIFK